MHIQSGKSILIGLLFSLAPFMLTACGTQQSATAPVKTSPTVTRSPTKTSAAKRPATPLSLLALAAQTQATQPVQMNITITDTLGNAHVQISSAVDPLNKESESIDRATLSGLSGANSSTVVGKTIRIGQHYWGESTPPGGGWHEGTVQHTNPFLLSELLPYIVNVYAVAGQFIRGHSTRGFTATLDKKGVRVLESFGAGRSINPAQQIIMSMVFTIWIGSAHHIRELHLTEDCVQDGHPYQVFEKIVYFHWGRGLHLTNPA